MSRPFYFCDYTFLCQPKYKANQITNSNKQGCVKANPASLVNSLKTVGDNSGNSVDHPGDGG